MHKRVRALRCNKPDAAGSMVTTAGDYARLLTAILNATGQRKATMDEMLRSQMAISSEQMFGMGAWWDTNKYQPIGLAWGLGWGRFDTEQGRAFFHAGHDVGYQNYTVAYPDKGIGIVLLSNSDNFESVAAEVPSAGDWRHNGEARPQVDDWDRRCGARAARWSGRPGRRGVAVAVKWHSPERGGRLVSETGRLSPEKPIGRRGHP